MSADTLEILIRRLEELRAILSDMIDNAQLVPPEAEELLNEIERLVDAVIGQAPTLQ